MSAIAGGAEAVFVPEFEPDPEDLIGFLMASCWYDEECPASVEGDEKESPHYGDRPQEVYDLLEDPLGRDNFADQRDPDELRRHRHDLLDLHKAPPL